MVYKPQKLQVSDGGSGTGSFTAYAPILAGTTSTGALQSAASVGTAGQVFTSNDAGAKGTFQDPGPLFALNLNTNITLSNNRTYFVTGTVSANMPTTAPFGSVIEIIGKSGGWTLTPQSGQTISFNGYATTLGGGTLASVADSDCVTLVCDVADTSWIVKSSIGNELQVT